MTTTYTDPQIERTIKVGETVSGSVIKVGEGYKVGSIITDKTTTTWTEG